MQTSEVVKVLEMVFKEFNNSELCIKKDLIFGKSNIYFASTENEKQQALEIREALTEAIRCVELLPELVDALEVSSKIIYHIDTDVSNEDYQEYIKHKELLKKAKGLSE